MSGSPWGLDQRAPDYTPTRPQPGETITCIDCGERVQIVSSWLHRETGTEFHKGPKPPWDVMHRRVWNEPIGITETDSDILNPTIRDSESINPSGITEDTPK